MKNSGTRKIYQIGFNDGSFGAMTAAKREEEKEKKNKKKSKKYKIIFEN